MMTAERAERTAQDAFQSMVGETGPYPNDPQHPDPGFDVAEPPTQAEAHGSTCEARDMTKAWHSA